MKLSSARVALLLCGAALCALPAQALAQATEDGAVSDVVVTGTRQAYRGDVALKDLPQVVSTIDARVMQDLGITNLSAALDMTSSVSRQNNFGGLWDSFAIRGFAGDENSGGIILVNGYRQGSMGPRDSATLERVEIYKGPTSALFGRGDPGGVVNLVTKRANFNERGQLAASLGSFANMRAELDVNHVLSDDKVAVRISGAYQDSESFRDYITLKKLAVAPSLLVKFSEKATLILDSDYTHTEAPFDRGVVAVGGKLGVVPISRFLGEPGDGATVIEGFNQLVQFQYDFSDDWSLIAGANYRDVSSQGKMNESDLGRQTLSATNPNLVRRRTDRFSDGSGYGYRIELNGNLMTGPIKHHLIFGTDYDRSKSEGLQSRYRSPAINPTLTMQQLNAINIYNPVYGYLAPATTPLTSTVGRALAYGYYAADQIDVTDKLTIRIAGRLDTSSSWSRNRLNGTVSILKREKFTPQVGVIYDITEDLSVYGSWGQGFRPQGGTNFFGVVFPPEESEAREIGLRYVTPGGRIAANFAVFDMDKTNVLVADPINAGFSIAAGGAKSRGVELEVNGRLSDSLRVFANYAYTDAFFSEAIIERDFGRTIAAGSPLINIPDHSGGLMVIKDLEVAGKAATIGGGVTYMGERLGETGTAFKLPDYTLVRVNASYMLTDSVKIYGEINNLFDEEHYLSSYAALWVMPGAPRNATVRLTYSF
jgi:iron complex outermembrane receptor protein